MDKRGLTHDPNVDPMASPRWFETIGPTQKPSPYATASWVCLQTYDVVFQEIFNPNGEALVLDNYQEFPVWLYPDVYDGGRFDQLDLPHLVLDSQIYTPGGGAAEYIKHTFASVRVYDSLASSPGDLAEIEIDLGLLAIDSDEIPVYIKEPIDKNELVVYDNGDRMQVPIPNPQQIYDSGSFALWGQGITLNGLEYEIIDGEQEIVDEGLQTFEDGSLLEADGLPDGGKFVEVTRIGTPAADVPPGKLLGEINYEMVECDVVITDWSHYNWMDDTPVRKAFKCLVNSLPGDIKNVYVKDAPHAFWTSLGFQQTNKGDRTLVYNDPTKIVPY
jgi:hypothetical protein